MFQISMLSRVAALSCAMAMLAGCIPQKDTMSEPGPETCADQMKGCEAMDVSIAGYFQQALSAGVVAAHGGRLHHGVEPITIMQAYVGILPEDFEGVAVRGGVMQAQGGGVSLVPNDRPQHSAGQSMSDAGYATLLDNILRRTGAAPKSAADIAALLERLKG